MIILKWEEIADSTTRKTEYLTNVTGKSPLVSNLSVEAHGSKEFYIAVWISETNSNQIDTNTGTYGGEVEFTRYKWSRRSNSHFQRV